MLEDIIARVMQCNNLRKTMLHINIVRQQKILIEKQQELDNLKVRVQVFGAKTRTFKQQFYRFLLDSSIANDKHFIGAVDGKRKGIVSELYSRIDSVNEQITKLNQAIALLKSKLNKVEHKLEKFRIIPELLNDEFSGGV